MSRVFISYGHEDLAVALELYDALLRTGHTPWLDKRDLVPGERWSERISDEIQKADFFVLLLSRHSFTRRGFLQKELRVALEVLDQIPSDQRFLIPVLLDDFKPSHATLRELHWCDLTQDRSTRLARLVTSLASRESAAEKLLVDASSAIPSDIGDWDDARLFSFIDDVLWPEAWYLAHSDYPSQFPTADTAAHIQALRERAWEKLQNAAMEYGFSKSLVRYRQYRHKDLGVPNSIPMDGSDANLGAWNMLERKFSLLIVEDEGAMVEDLQRMFAPYSEVLTVLVARDAGEALKQIEALRPDILLLDLLMPYGSAEEALGGASDPAHLYSGLRLLSRLRKQEEEGADRIKVSVITALSEIGIHSELRQLLGPDDCIYLKPFDTLKLEDQVVSTLGIPSKVPSALRQGRRSS